LEKNYGEDMNEKETIKLAIKSLLEVVQTGAKNIEIAVMASDNIVKV
jgi:20S proteasome subunit alpha 4